jgi:peptidoglycan DL-endopeptidase CwlO
MLSGRTPEQAPVRHKRGTLAGAADRRKSRNRVKSRAICRKIAVRNPGWFHSAQCASLLACSPVRAERPTRAARILVAILAVLAAGVSTDVGGADRASSLRERASSLRADTATLTAESHAALVQLYALETELDNARARAASLAARAAEVQQEQVRVRRHLGAARRALTIAERGAADRLRALYEEGEVDPLSVLLGSSTFDEALTRMDHVNRMAELDRHIAHIAQRARHRLDELSRRLAAREARLVSLRRDAEAAAASLSRARAERTAYVARLVERRRLNESQISSLEDQAGAAEARAREVAAEASPAPAEPTPTPAVRETAEPPAGGLSGRTMTVVSTAYALTGTTATGIPVGPGIVAVDPAVIPLGTRMTIPGYGEGVAADTGGAIIGARIDVWVPTEAQAANWGVRTVTITLH